MTTVPPNSLPLADTATIEPRPLKRWLTRSAAIAAILLFAIALLGAVLLSPRSYAPAPDVVNAADAGVRVELAANPPHLMPGEPTTLTYRLANADTGRPLADLAASHGRQVHVLLISTDLSDFQRLCPDEIAPGVFQLTFTPSVDTHYLAYATFSRNGVWLQDLRHLVNHSGRIAMPSLRVDVGPKLVDGLQIELSSAGELRSGQEALFGIHVTRADNGEPISNLQTLLGSAGRVAIASADGRRVIDAHLRAGAEASGVMGDSAPSATFGPDLGFTGTFDEPGLFQIWVQLQHEAHVVTAPFVVDVK